MTCIVSLIDQDKTIHMAGDAASVRGYWTVTTLKAPKVFVNHGFLMGSAGDARTSQLLRHAFVPPDMPEDMELEEYMSTLFVNMLRETLKEAGVAKKSDEKETHENETLVGYQGRLFVIGSHYSVTESVNAYAAVGTGEDHAMGSLYTTEIQVSRKYFEPQKRLEMALKAAMYFCNGVREPLSYLELPMRIEEDQKEVEVQHG